MMNFNSKFCISGSLEQADIVFNALFVLEKLSQSKINELPQLLNIFFGHMSVVGARPVMQKSFDAYPAHVQDVIYNVKPCITGIGSIVFRDEEELITDVKNAVRDTWDFYKNTIYPHKDELEKWYQKNQSFWTDLKIIFATAWVVLKPNM